MSPTNGEKNGKPDHPGEGWCVTEATDALLAYDDGPGDTTVRPVRANIPLGWYPRPVQPNQAATQTSTERGTGSVNSVTHARLAERLELADQLLFGRATMLAPQDLPGRYGRVVKAVDRLLQVLQCEAVLGGGWAVWRHGYVGRVTQDVDVALPADRVDEFLQTASVAGFEILPVPPGHRPKLTHKDTGIEVDVLPEGGRPGTASRLAPTTIPHPSLMGAGGPRLRYITLPSLIELKIAAGRARDVSDVVELIRVNPDEVAAIRHHLTSVHADYVRAFDDLARQAREQDES